MKIIKFKNPKNWVINGEEVLIEQIQTTRSHIGVFNKRVRFDDLDMYAKTRNILRNVALLPNASFIEFSNENILARITDVSGNTLVRTEWVVSKEIFNVEAHFLQREFNIEDFKFHIISKIS